MVLLQSNKDLLRTKGNSKKELAFSAWLSLSWYIAWSFSAFWLMLKNGLFLGLETVSLQSGTYTFCFPGSWRPLDWDWNSTINFPGTPACQLKIRYFSASTNMWVNSLWYTLRNIVITSNWFCFLWEFRWLLWESYLPDYLTPIKGWVLSSFYWAFSDISSD